MWVRVGCGDCPEVRGCLGGLCSKVALGMLMEVVLLSPLVKLFNGITFIHLFFLLLVGFTEDSRQSSLVFELKHQTISLYWVISLGSHKCINAGAQRVIHERRGILPMVMHILRASSCTLRLFPWAWLPSVHGERQIYIHTFIRIFDLNFACVDSVFFIIILNNTAIDHFAAKDIIIIIGGDIKTYVFALVIDGWAFVAINVCFSKIFAFEILCV